MIAAGSRVVTGSRNSAESPSGGRQGAVGPESSQSQAETVHETTLQVSEGVWSLAASHVGGR